MGGILCCSFILRTGEIAWQVCHELALSHLAFVCYMCTNHGINISQPPSLVTLSLFKKLSILLGTQLLLLDVCCPLE
jgi:hypothetical protein